MRLVISVILILWVQTAYVQKSNKLLNYLLQENLPDGMVIQNNLEDQLSLGNEYYERKHHTYVRWKKGLYLVLGGSGNVLKLEKTSDTSFSYTKIDSTLFTGNNFHSFSFVADSVLYNYGGYGHWRFNGHLRRYNFVSHEWEIVPLNMEIPFKNQYPLESFAFTNYPKNDKLFLTGRVVGNQAIKPGANNDITPYKELWELDLQKAIWKKLGNISEDLTKTNYGYLITCELGTLMFKGNDIFLFDYKNPILFRAKTNSPKKQLLYKLISTTVFAKNNTIYHGSFRYNTLDSIQLSKSDFEPSGIQFYKKETPYLLIFGGIGCVVIMAGLIYFIRNKNKKREQTSEEINLDIATVFDEKELLVLKTIVFNSERMIDTYIEHLNQILGLEKKKIDVQKKQRSDVLIGINTKLNLLLNTSEQIIQKKRVETDKRSFCYFIDPDNIQKVKELIE